MIAREQLDAACHTACARLLDERVAAGHWVGELASSPLSTATAVSALSLVRRAGAADNQKDPEAPSAEQLEQLIEGGIRWLLPRQNPDGGFGDTDRSHSNIATTMLALAACDLSGHSSRYATALARAEAYVERQGGLAGLRRRYGRDRTFAVPILTNYALAGRVAWNQVVPLPFELACVPQRFYRFIRLPVVSYAIPALVAMGQARHFFRPSWFLPWRWLRAASIGPSLRVLQRMQPASGGYLEATPLTSFVVMSLAATGRANHAVTRSGVRFLVDSVRRDGSWPIDTNLATWNTTLAINALATAGEDVSELTCWDWLQSCQHRVRHPFTGAEPGGWGWTDLSGAVPDSDDTPSALLALAAGRDAAREQGRSDSESATSSSCDLEAVGAGLRWLLRLQNRDGGWPTFCRGWGKLPFDRSGADLTAHALRAFLAWQSETERGCFERQGVTWTRVTRAAERAFRYLARQQRPDGAWVPLWFGNQDDPREENPVYGTSKVLLAYAAWGQGRNESAQRARHWLVSHQQADGAWGAPPSAATPGNCSVEETSLALDALCALHQAVRDQSELGSQADPEFLPLAIRRGIHWLLGKVEEEDWEARPIGFYFAKLWYYERLYPLVFAVSALGRCRQLLAAQEPTREGCQIGPRSGISECGAIKGHG